MSAIEGIPLFNLLGLAAMAAAAVTRLGGLEKTRKEDLDRAKVVRDADLDRWEKVRKEDRELADKLRKEDVERADKQRSEDRAAFKEAIEDSKKHSVDLLSAASSGTNDRLRAVETKQDEIESLMRTGLDSLRDAVSQKIDGALKSMQDLVLQTTASMNKVRDEVLENTNELDKRLTKVEYTKASNPRMPAAKDPRAE